MTTSALITGSKQRWSDNEINILKNNWLTNTREALQTKLNKRGT